ncbi:hypothetical protein BURKHO8Y_30086 [Burkholderia sp. 8Y]|nr:hypothetical protein BURKHO8Y_30086 [Burkholderia sp. 8Y]
MHTHGVKACCPQERNVAATIIALDFINYHAKYARMPAISLGIADTYTDGHAANSRTCGAPYLTCIDTSTGHQMVGGSDRERAALATRKPWNGPANVSTKPVCKSTRLLSQSPLRRFLDDAVSSVGASRVIRVRRANHAALIP